MDAYWSEATNVGEPKELRRLASEVGLNTDEVDRVILVSEQEEADVD